MISSIRRTSLFFKLVSMVLIFIFPLTNVSFALSGVKGYSETIVKASHITPLLRIANGVSWVLDPDKRDEVVSLNQEMGVAGSDQDQFMSWIEKSETILSEIVEMATDKWIEKVKESMEEQLGLNSAMAEWNQFVQDDERWEAFRSLYIGKYQEGAVLRSVFEDLLIEKFDANRQLWADSDTPGKGHVSWGDQDQLSKEEAKKIDKAIKETIENEGVITEEKVGNGTFVVLDSSVYDLIAQEYDADLMVMCHPGTNGTKEVYDGSNFDKVEQKYYIKDSIYNNLTDEDKITIANHEEMHIKITLGELEISDKDMKKYKNEEAFINHQPGCDIRPIMAQLGSEVHKMDLAREKPIYSFGSDLKGESITESVEEGHKPSDGWVHLLGGKGANLAGLASAVDSEGNPIPVPPGFTLSTAVAEDYVASKPDENGKRFLPPPIKLAIDEYIEKLEKATGRKFGDTNANGKPLLLSVRSGARISMPGMMDTVLNLGLNDETVGILAKEFNNEWFAWDSYRRLIMMFGDVVLGVAENEDKENVFEQIMDEQKEIVKKRLKTDKTIQDTDFEVEDLKELVKKFKKHIKDRGKEFPDQDEKDKNGKVTVRAVDKQLYLGIQAVFDSSFVERVIKYRKLNDIPEDTLSAVNVQTMVFGNLNDNSATGVCFTRDPGTGENVFYGEWLRNAQGEDVVAGIRTPMPINIVSKQKFLEKHPEYEGREHEITTLEEEMPEAYAHLVSVYKAVEKYQQNMQDMEFTIQNGNLYLLQTRHGKRTAVAALNILMDMVEEGLIDKKEALKRLGPDQIDSFLHPIFDQKDKEKAISEGRLLTTGLNASPGAAVGKIVFSSAEAERWAARGEHVLLVRNETSPADIGGMNAAQGILTARGGLTSHAAVVCRGWGKTAVVGASDISIYDRGDEKYIMVNGTRVNEGEVLSIDGSTGEVFIGEIKKKDSVVMAGLRGEKLEGEDKKLYERFITFFQWEEEYRLAKIKQYHVGGTRANAETPRDVNAAFNYFDADGIGLARTEHMFFEDSPDATVEENRIIKFRKMILTNKLEDLKEIEGYQANDFYKMLSRVKGRPVTVRLVDPPLHEFLPHIHTFTGTIEDNLKVIKEFSKRFNVYDKEWTTARIMEEADKLTKSGKLKLSEVQVEVAILAQHLKWTPEELVKKIAEKREKNPMAGLRGARLLMKYPVIAETQFRGMFKALSKLNIKYSPIEIEIPLTTTPEEVLFFKPIIARIAAEYGFEHGKDYKIGTMIETPAAAMMAGEMAKYLDFMSFGTNDLTQFLFKFSRDDAGNIVIPEYMKNEILKVNPFKSLDELVVEMIRIAVAQAKAANPDIEIGLCGEQGGDPASVVKLVEAGLDFTSCSPYRLYAAKLATTQYLIEREEKDKPPVVKYDLNNLEAPSVNVQTVDVKTTEDVMTDSSVINHFRRFILIQTKDITSVISEKLMKDLSSIKTLDEEAKTKAVTQQVEKEIALHGEKIKIDLSRAVTGSENAFIRLFNMDFYSVFNNMSEEEHDSFITSTAVYFQVDKELIKNTIEKLEEFNPAMGLRGTRQATTWYKELYAVQFNAIFDAMKADENYAPNIVVPLLVKPDEFSMIKTQAEEIARRKGIDRSRFKIGASIETGSAALYAGEMAELADFIIFNNTGLTESVLSLTRGDAYNFIPMWIENGIYNNDPFKLVPERNVGRFINLAVKRAKEEKEWIPIYSYGTTRKEVASASVPKSPEKEAVLETTAMDASRISEEIAETGEYGVNVKVRFMEDGEVLDIVTIHDEGVWARHALPLMGGREYTIKVLDGSWKMVVSDGDLLPEFSKNDIIEIKVGKMFVNGERVKGLFSDDPAETNQYTIVKTSKEPLVLEVTSEQPEIEKASYAAYREIRTDDILQKITSNKIDLILPQDSFKGTGESSKKTIQKQYDASYGKGVINIVTFNVALEKDLAVAIENSLKSGRIPVLASTRADIADISSETAKKALENVRVLPLADRENILMDTLGSIALMQAALKAEDIKEKDNTFAQKMLRLMSNLTGTELSVSDLYYLLPFSDDAIPADIKTSDVVNWLQKIFEKLPMIKLVGTVSEEFQKRLRFMYSA